MSDKNVNVGSDNPRFSHGMFENVGNFDHKEKLQVIAQAEEYIQQLGGKENVNQIDEWDAYLLALTEFRIARAEGVMMENIEEYLEKQRPEQNLQMLVERRQRLRDDLGLLDGDLEDASKEDGFFDSLTGN